MTDFEAVARDLVIGSDGFDRNDIRRIVAALRRVAAEARAEAFKECLLVIQDEIEPADCGTDSYHYARCAEHLFTEIAKRAAKEQSKS